MIASLAGVPLCGNQAHTWRLTPGVRPYQTVVEVPASDAARILARKGEPTTLVLGDVVAERVYILGSTAGSRPDTAGVLIADRRHLLARKWVARDYNLRRRTGVARLVGEGNFRIENARNVADVAYATWSLRNGAPWRPAEMLADVLREAAGDGVFVPAVRRAIEVEDLSINAPGDVAVAQALDHLAGYEMTVDLAGQIRVYDTRDGSERAAVERAGPIGVDTGSYRMADRSATRPSEAIILIEREPEIRFDFEEDERPSTTIRGDGREPRKLENVIAVPDVTIEIDGKTVTQGTIVEIGAYLDALRGRQPASAPGPLTHAVIRQHWLQMWDMLTELYGRDSAGFPDPVWLKRMNAIRRSWRQFFRPLPEWRDKVRQFREYRAGIVDVENRSRAPAEAFMDWVAKPAYHGIARRASGNADIGYQIEGWAALLEDGRAAPAKVTIVDADQGLVRVDLVRDALGDVESMAPGQVDRLPSLALRNSNAGEALVAWQASTLTDTFRMAVVLTCLQAAPNSIGRFHAVKVTPGTAGQMLGRQVGPCLGAPVAVALGAGLITARCAWLDDRASQIEEAFYAGGPYPDVLVNRDQVQAVAEATAARIYETYLDRVQGSFAVPLNRDVRVTGAISEVAHTIGMRGELTTTIGIAPEFETVSAAALLPTSVQRTLRGMVQP